MVTHDMASGVFSHCYQPIVERGRHACGCYKGGEALTVIYAVVWALSFVWLLMFTLRAKTSNM
jgi:hypothetical protein